MGRTQTPQFIELLEFLENNEHLSSFSPPGDEPLLGRGRRFSPVPGCVLGRDVKRCVLKRRPIFSVMSIEQPPKESSKKFGGEGDRWTIKARDDALRVCKRCPLEYSTWRGRWSMITGRAEAEVTEHLPNPRNRRVEVNHQDHHKAVLCDLSAW